MGQFSWLDCVTGKPILDGVARTSYVLVPQEFGGGHIKESCYDGYGDFGGYDIYELVADWNRNYLTEYVSSSVPKLEDYGGLWSFEIDNLKKQGYSDEEIDRLDKEAQQNYYQAALQRADTSVQCIADFSSGEYTDAQLRSMYGDDYKREIGIDIACDNDDNRQLVYPIKITYAPDATYEECEYSPRDPNQGWSVPTPCNEFYGVSARLPAGVELDESKVTDLVMDVLSGEITGSPDISIQDAISLRIDDGFEDPYAQEAIDYYPDDEFSIHINCVLTSSDVDQYVMLQFYDVFEAAGYEILDVYYENTGN